jgi:hypothetical protein
MSEQAVEILAAVVQLEPAKPAIVYQVGGTVPNVTSITGEPYLRVTDVRMEGRVLVARMEARDDDGGAVVYEDIVQAPMIVRRRIVVPAAAQQPPTDTSKRKEK